MGTSKRTKQVKVKFNEAELKTILDELSHTTEKHISVFARKKLLGKTIVFKYRNKSIDDLLTELVQLRNDLKMAMSGEHDHDEIARKIDQINSGIGKIADICLQKSMLEKASKHPCITMKEK